MRFASRPDELEDFKRNINLCEYASSHGFEIDRKKSGRSSAVMRHPNGEKIIVARGSNGHWIYFNPHDDRDQGTIIDFIQLRDQSSLGAVRKTLRGFTGSALTTSSPIRFRELVPCEQDLAQVMGGWLKAKPIDGSHAYLESRAIRRDVLADPKFADRIRIDSRGNALFPHWNADAMSGFEVKNRRFTGFSPGGVKGLWCSRPSPDDQELYIAETAIDALSVASLIGVQKKRFLSTAGQISPTQALLLKSAVEKMPTNSTIYLAMDNDPPGRKLAEVIQHELSAIAAPRRIVPYLPDHEGDDWNDVLQRTRGRCAIEPKLD